MKPDKIDLLEEMCQDMLLLIRLTGQSDWKHAGIVAHDLLAEVIEFEKILAAEPMR
jgi:hypothetical protein